MPEYLSVIHVYHKCDDDLSAINSADDIKLILEGGILNTDDGEAVDIVQTIPTDEAPEPSANVIQLRRARNILLRTRTKDNYDMARELDKAIFIMHHRLPVDMGLVGYDWGKFMEVVKDILDGKNPLEC